MLLGMTALWALAPAGAAAEKEGRQGADGEKRRACGKFHPGGKEIRRAGQRLRDGKFLPAGEKPRNLEGRIRKGPKQGNADGRAGVFGERIEQQVGEDDGRDGGRAEAGPAQKPRRERRSGRAKDERMGEQLVVAVEFARGKAGKVVQIGEAGEERGRGDDADGVRHAAAGAGSKRQGSGNPVLRDERGTDDDSGRVCREEASAGCERERSGSPLLRDG